MIKMFRLRVIRFQLVILDRPRRGNSAVMLDGAKVFAPQPKKRGAVEFRVAANTVIGMRMEFLPLPVVPDLFGLILAFNVHSPSAPVVLFARHVVTALEQKNP